MTDLVKPRDVAGDIWRTCNNTQRLQVIEMERERLKLVAKIKRVKRNGGK